ncbi:hypothetical protein HMPREF9104_02146 [Lentilactobacillus kisonensis F0435]|uniref:Uncharacterized protein n=1 Tax=Lentilactobacillus kisonensis F0435 TaxID=797516 RepID=H1LHQ5_9LACO|nr:hypothetical protein HMPREF9104_02146 [Lentilactobacillus kisonensis F0435]
MSFNRYADLASAISIAFGNGFTIYGPTKLNDIRLIVKIIRCGS